MAKKKVNAKDLVHKIEKIAKERMARENLVSLSEYRKFKNKSFYLFGGYHFFILNFQN